MNMTGMYNNPLLNFGMNVLANNQGSALQSVGQGFQQAQQQDQRSRQQKLLEQYRQMQMAELMQRMNQKPERKTLKGADGYTYYQDTGERVLPNVKAAPDPQTMSETQRLAQAIEAYPPGSPTRKILEARLKKLTHVGPMTEIKMPGNDPMADIPSTTDLLKYVDETGNPPPYPMTVGELRSSGYRLQGNQSESDKRASYVADSLSTASKLVENTLNKDSFNPAALSNYAGDMTNLLASSDYQQYKSASDEWATNLVFLRSGATAREEEKQAAFRNFWPQPGDSPETIKFKRIFRLQQENNAYANAAQSGRVGAEMAEKRIADNERRIAEIQGNTESEQSGNLFNDADAIADEILSGGR